MWHAKGTLSFDLPCKPAQFVEGDSLHLFGLVVSTAEKLPAKSPAEGTFAGK